MQAIGNTWNASVQGADAFGRYTTRRLVDGTSLDARDTNFNLPSATTKIQV